MTTTQILSSEQDHKMQLKNTLKSNNARNMHTIVSREMQ